MRQNHRAGLRAGLAAGALVAALTPGAGGVALAQPVIQLPPRLDPHLPAVGVPASPGGWVPMPSGVPEGVSVEDRPRIDYQPVGGRLGSFFLYPDAKVTDRYTDNVRASDAHKFGGDAVMLGAGAQLISAFSRHQLRAGAWYERTMFIDHSSESSSEYGGAVSGRLDFQDSVLTLRGSAERAVVPRDDVNNIPTARSPQSYDRLRGDIGVVHHFNRLTISARGTIARVSYLNVIDDSGQTIDQRYQNATSYSGVAEVAYNLRPGFDVFARGVYTKLSYSLPANDPAQPGGLDRDSHGWRPEGGVRLALTRVLYGEIRLGYLTRDYADPRLLRARGFAYGGDLLWNPTALTSIRINADRRIEEASSTTAAGNRVTEFGIGIGHELRRNILVTANGRRRRYTPLGPGISSTEWSGEVGARYFLNRQFSLNAGYRYSTRNAADPARAYAENIFTCGITVAL